MDLSRELGALRAKLRLLTLSWLGSAVVLIMAMGGADATAKAVVMADAWRVQSKNLGGTLTPRLTITGDEDVAKIKVLNGNIELFPQTTAQLPGSAVAGTIGYDSTVNKLKFHDGSSWVEPGVTHALVRKATTTSAVSDTTLDADSELNFAIGASQKWVATWHLVAFSTVTSGDIKVAIAVPAGATVTYWVSYGATGASPETAQRMTVKTAAGTAVGSGLLANLPTAVVVRAEVSNGATPGSVQLQWAQNTSNANATEVRAGSILEATRVQ